MPRRESCCLCLFLHSTHFCIQLSCSVSQSPSSTSPFLFPRMLVLTLFPRLQALVDKRGDAQEGELLTYLADFTSTVQYMATVQLLSSRHADDQQTLDKPNKMITVSTVVAAGAYRGRGEMAA